MQRPNNERKKHTMYRTDSDKAAEFIDDAQIGRTLEYAARNRNDEALVSEILDKAAEGRGLGPREAAVHLE